MRAVVGRVGFGVSTHRVSAFPAQRSHFRPSGYPQNPALTPHLHSLYAVASLTPGAGVRQILAAIRMGLFFNVHIIHLAAGFPFPNTGPEQQSQCVTYHLRVTPKLYVPVPGLGHSWGNTDAAFAVSTMDGSANQHWDAKMQPSKRERRTFWTQLRCPHSPVPFTPRCCARWCVGGGRRGS